MPALLFLWDGGSAGDTTVTPMWALLWNILYILLTSGFIYRQTRNMRLTKSKNLNVARLIL